MSQGVWTIAVFDIQSTNEAVNRVKDLGQEIGFEIREDDARTMATGTYLLPISYQNHSTNLMFRLDDERDEEAEISFGRLLDTTENEAETHDTVEAIFELICKISTELNAAYTAMVHTEKRSMEVVPEDRPIPEAVETPPRLGVYAEDVLAGFGGVEGLFDHDPWYVAELEDGHTLVIESESTWGDWRPPTEASYIRSAEFPTDESTAQSNQSDETALSDPFAPLEPGAYGTDVCVDPDDIAAEFRNEDLELVRVYVDEERTLRRVRDDSFVRNLVVDAPDDNVAFVKAMLADVPSDAAATDPRVSALLNDAIPPSFVRADGPDDETVASRVLALPVNTSKIELLVSLGRAVRRGEEMDATTVESAVENLAELDDPREIEEYIETNLL